MSQTFGDARTIPASDQAKTCMKQLVASGIFREQRDVWRLGVAVGIAMGQTLEPRDMGTFQNINSLDTDEIFAAVMTGLYPDLSADELLKKLVSHAEWGIREIYRKHQNGTLDWGTIGVPVRKK